jgi:sulfhydrogenase subunit beta (sulfur reductase)
VPILMLAKDQLRAFCTALMQGHRLIAPVRRGGELRFERVGAPEEVVLDYRNTTKAPKNILFPQTECMIRFDQRLDQFNVVREATPDVTPTIVLGIRPCDARSFLMLDRVFVSAQYVDPYYMARRENTLLFSLACDHPRPTCFCHAFGSGPYDATGSDVLLREAGDAYLLEPLSERGQATLEGLSMAAADQIHLAKAQEIEVQAQARQSPIEPVAGIEKQLPALWDSKIWAEVAEKCIACGTCTYSCPGCHCFNIEDRVLAHGGERVRAWDGCMYPNFTQHASGHNPRPDQGARWRQRIMHKFEYLPRNVSAYGCVGCGRCILSCPVRLDIREVLRRVRAAAVKAQPAEVKG